jgi:hypothetical protein
MSFPQPSAKPLGDLNLSLKVGVDPGFVGPEAYTILGALFKKNNMKLPIQNEVQNLIFI